MRNYTQRAWKQYLELNRVDGKTQPGVFTWEKINPPAKVTLAAVRREIKLNKFYWFSSLRC